MDQRAGDVRLPTDFELAAQALGHDATTTVGAADARRDHRVWDLLDEIDRTVIDATAFIRDVRRTADDAAIREHITEARTSIRRARGVRP